MLNHTPESPKDGQIMNKKDPTNPGLMKMRQRMQKRF